MRNLPRMEPVDSEAIAAMGYDPPSRTLYLRFRSGGLYAYVDVAPEVFDGLRAAESKGRFFHERIDGPYRFERLDAHSG